MGDIADMMIDGEMCQNCGEILDPPLGYPGYCASCSADEKEPEPDYFDRVMDNYKATCNVCGRTLKSEAGMKQHKKDKHGLI